MKINTGAAFEEEVYSIVKKLIDDNDFILSYPHIKIKRKSKYYSKEREDYIITDVSVEKIH